MHQEYKLKLSQRIIPDLLQYTFNRFYNEKTKFILAINIILQVVHSSSNIQIKSLYLNIIDNIKNKIYLLCIWSGLAIWYF